MTHRLNLQQLVGAFVVVFVGLFAAFTFSGAAAAHHPEISATTDRDCGDNTSWTATITARSDSDWNKDWRSRHAVQGTTSEWSATTDDQVPYVVEVGPFSADTPTVTVNVESQWFEKDTGEISGSGTNETTVTRPADSVCMTEPGTPAVTYDCATNTIAIIGADDTTSVDYTITIDDPADGEGDTWAITITATPQPGYEFDPYATTEWDFSGTVDCLDTSEPGTPAATYDCATDTIAIIGADDTTSVDYTITIDDPADGEGDTWAITITATPQPGYEFPTGTTTEWNFSGTVDCLDTSEPGTPAATYDCATDTIAIIGADDTTSVDYTITIDDPADGEGDTWAITITATPQPGYEFPTGTTTEWNFSGTVDCLDTSEPGTPAATYDCATDTIAIIGADDTTSVDYTITIDDPADGEGDTWAITITATPQPGYEFPAGTTTEWNFSGTVDCLIVTTAVTPALICENDHLAIDAPVSDEYSYSVDGDLSAAEGTAYSITVTATPANGYTFTPGARDEWSFTGTVDCVDEQQVPPGSTTTTMPTGTSGTQPTTPATRLPQTGSSSTSILLAYASVLVLSGGTLQLVRRWGRSTRTVG